MIGGGGWLRVCIIAVTLLRRFEVRQMTIPYVIGDRSCPG